ncbi:ATP-binding cassette domain-containing protein [Chengkuizengella axinellae]|uniref:ABC transporter ATP-binding protein n=1 Tax=Chengkuizengella axinellae TaxID=3064388 RepID=A0ABT9J039_9BACL|nr:ABC transporter ATP-binding protein [Chengkuizengella sp. 2205SS18-9]MDP5274843.1 ABC transporter ATP-binding protein [Chengkuizengella sp. 2205SS18-9]
MIEVSNVRFSYIKKNRSFLKTKVEQIPILKGVNITINKGELFGLIGPNGSGKTTFTKLLMGVYQPNEGEIVYDNTFSPSLKNPKWKKLIGWISGANSRLFSTITLNEHVVLYRNLYEDFNESWFMEKIEEFNLIPRLDQLPTSISFGERIKFEIAITLAYFPKVLILDEPTVGLDPLAIKEIRQIINEYLSDFPDVCGILTSHNLNDIVEISKQYAFLHKNTFVGMDQNQDKYANDIENQYIHLYGGN